MKIATWNVNSLNIRMPQLAPWVQEAQPDVLCLQETKCVDENFPVESLRELGYEAAFIGQKSYNGVAILSRRPLESPESVDFCADNPQARHIAATIDGIRIVNLYVPNGKAIGAPHFAYKLSWLDRLHAHVQADTSPDADVIVTGDFNIAPEDRDVYDPAKFVGATHVSRPERDRLQTLVDWGLVDLFRRQHPDAGSVYSWWDYRAGDFHQGRGMRIDLLMCTPSVVERSEWCVIDRNARKGKQPSDHAPVIADFAPAA